MKRAKLKKILKVLDPTFKDVGEEIRKIKKNLKQKVKIEVLSDVKGEIERLRSSIDLTPLRVSITRLEERIFERVYSIERELVDSTEAHAEALREEIRAIASKKQEVVALKDNVKELESLRVSTEESISKLREAFEGVKNDKTHAKLLKESLDSLRKEFFTKFQEIGGGGQNRRIQINGTVMSSKYTDVNFIGGITAVDNNTTKQVDITFTGGSGGGARSVTLSVASSTALNPSEYDYQCDGTADQVQINQAISDLPAGGGRIVLSEGTFTLSATVTMIKSNVILEGQGASTVILMPDTTTGFLNNITLSGSNTNMEVCSLMVDGDSNINGGYGIYLASAVSRSTIRNCYVKNTGFANIFVDGADYCSITNNTLDTTIPNSFFANIEGGGSYLNISENFCYGGDFSAIALYTGDNEFIQNNVCFTGNNDATISLADDNCIVSGNYIQSNNTNFFAGILTTGLACSITGNFIKMESASTGDGAVIEGGSTSFTGNSLVCSSTQEGVAVIRANQNAVEIVGNTVVFNSGDANEAYGIILQDNYMTVSSNTIAFSGTRTGAAILDLAGNNSIYGNSIGVNGGLTFGIGASNTAGDVITNNAISFTDYGISIASTSSTVVSNNLITGGSQSGISSVEDPVSRNIITGNSIYDYVMNGIDIGSSSGAESVDNVISANSIGRIGRNGITLRYCRNTAVTGNSLTDCGRTTNDTYSDILITAGTSNSTYNTITGNTIRAGSGNAQRYGIREGSASDGPNIVSSNVVQGAVTANISLQNGGSISANNLP